MKINRKYYQAHHSNSKLSVKSQPKRGVNSLAENQRILASVYNRPANELPTYTINKYRLVANILNDIFEGKSETTILECGSGPKTVAEELLIPHLSRNITHIGIDNNSHYADSATIQSDIIALPLLDNYADGIICLDVLEHLPDLTNVHLALSEMKRVSKPSSPVIICIPSMYNLDRFKIPSLNYGTHTIKQNPREWQDIVNRYFSVEKTLGVGVLEVLNFLPQFSRLLPLNSKDNLQGFERAWYKFCQKLSLGSFDPFFYKTGINKIPIIKKYCDGYMMICTNTKS